MLLTPLENFGRLSTFPHYRNHWLCLLNIPWLPCNSGMWIPLNLSVCSSFYPLSVQFSSVAQLCLTLCSPMDCSMPGIPVLHHLPELAQTYLHWVGDAIQPSHPLLSPSPPAFNLSQHQGLFQWIRKWQPTLVFFPGESHGRGAWQATVHGVTRVGHDLATKERERERESSLHQVAKVLEFQLQHQTYPWTPRTDLL